MRFLLDVRLILQCQRKNCVTEVIPQGTVDNNLGPDRIAGTKALDPDYCRQPAP